MFGLFAAFGPISKQFSVERLRDLWISGSKMQVFSDNANATMVRFVPENHPEIPAVYSSGDGKLHLAMDGYVIMRSAQKTSGLPAQVDSLIEMSLPIRSNICRK
jgi:hypothetical protein